jgi:lipopolysaccharide export system permease protein
VPRILFWYVTREFLLPFVCCLLAFAALFVILDLFDVLEDMLQSKGAGIGQLLVFFLVRLPVNLPQVLPMSVLLSASFMVSNFQRHHEIAAMRASGLSLLVCARPVWIMGVLLSVVSLWVSEALAPSCKVVAEQMRDAWTETAEYRETHGHLSYSNMVARRDWFFHQFDPHGDEQGVFVKQFRPDSTVEWELLAKRAQHVGGEWVFYDGELSRFDDQGRLPVGVPDSFQRKAMPELTETPVQIANQLRPVEELSIRNMLAIMRVNPDLPRRSRRMLRTTIWYRLTFPFSCLVGALLGISLAIARERASALRGFAVAVGLMVLYYIVCQIGLVLGQQSYLPAVVGGALPTATFLGVGVWQMYRKR